MKITNLVEQIFAMAVALDQNGGLKNTIYAIGSEIFILNYDHTVLLRFKLRKTEGSFDHPISFKANDYDSNSFEEVDGKIIFTSSQDGYTKKKICGTTELAPAEVKELFEKYLEDFDQDQEESILSKSVLSLLEDGLSHVEFNAKKKESLKIVQRNIYTGGLIEIQKDGGGFFQETFKKGFGPVAMKTSDFQALFTFQDKLKFYFPEKDGSVIVVRNVQETKRDMTGIVAGCLYDEVIALREATKSEEPKMKRGK